MSSTFDVIIVGGGPAGLSAALILGRCRRRVLLCDDGQPRNAAADALHGFLTRDGESPAELRRLGRGELQQYGIHYRGVRVIRAQCADAGFIVTLEGGETCDARKILLATGVRDELPRLDGLQPMYGRSVHHCPYCDGWEWRDQPLAVYGRGPAAEALALKLLGWSRNLTICSDGDADLNSAQRRKLNDHGIEIIERRIARLEGENGLLRRIVFEDGSALPRSAMFFTTGQGQRSDLADQLGCRHQGHGGVKTDDHERTTVRGVYLAGDASRDVQLAIVAAAEGACAAVAINHDLLKDDDLA